MSKVVTTELCGLTGVSSLYMYSLVLILAIVSIVGNITVVAVISRQSTLQKSPLVLYGLLALVDVIISCVIVPVNAKIALHTRYICQDFFWGMFAMALLSLATIVLITFDQLAHVYYLENYPFSYKNILLGLIGCWAPPILFASIKIKGLAGALISIALFFIYVTAIICCYVAMIIALNKRRSLLNTNVRDKCIDQQRKSATTLVIIILIYIMTHISSLLCIVFQLLGQSSPILYGISVVAIIANSALNPIVYFLRIRTLRKYVLMLFGLEKIRDRFKESGDENHYGIDNTKQSVNSNPEQEKNFNNGIIPVVRVKIETDV